MASQELEAFAKEHGQLTAVVKHLKLVTWSVEIKAMHVVFRFKRFPRLSLAFRLWSLISLCFWWFLYVFLCFCSPWICFFFKTMFSMIHGPLGPVRSVRSHTRRWETLEVGHLFGKFSFESAIFCVRRCPDGSWWQLRKKQHMDTKDTGNLWKSDHQFLTLDCKAGNVMIAKTHPDFPSDICLLLSTLNAKLTLMNAKRKTEMLGQKYRTYMNIQFSDQRC